jgi:hypothetical protein
MSCPSRCSNSLTEKPCTVGARIAECSRTRREPRKEQLAVHELEEVEDHRRAHDRKADAPEAQPGREHRDELARTHHLREREAGGGDRAQADHVGVELEDARRVEVDDRRGKRGPQRGESPARHGEARDLDVGVELQDGVDRDGEQEHHREDQGEVPEEAEGDPAVEQQHQFLATCR